MIKSKKHFLINDNFFSELLNSKITIIDGGARGQLFNPFSKVIPSKLLIIRFEPDSNANISKSKNQIIYNKGIWKKQETIKLYLAQQPTTSSVFKNNTLLHKEFKDSQNTIPRKTINQLEIECESLNDIKQELDLESIDFIKLDIHGAEYEALLGADKILEHCLGLMVETWLSPIHLNQKTHAKVESLLNDFKFHCFEIMQSHAFERKKVSNEFSKLQNVILETLYFRNVMDVDLNKKQLLKTIAIADLFNHNTYALQLNNLAYSKKLIQKNEWLYIQNYIVKNNPNTFVKRIIPKIIAKLNLLLK